jgi:hypothetical protein
MISRRARVVSAAVVGVVVGVAYPIVDLAVACRIPASEGCVWGKAYLPLTFGLSFVILGGIVAAIVYAVLSWQGRKGRTSDAV